MTEVPFDPFAAPLRPGGYRDEFWAKGDQRVHVPVRVDVDTVEVSYEALADLLADAGYIKEES